MKRKLYIIGNGFDLAHNLPTKFDPDFKNITRKYEYQNFWDIYQEGQDDIWSDFENLLGYPDFNSLEEIFNCYFPDYLSDRESDRVGIIYQVELNGHLYDALEEFANQAEQKLSTIYPKLQFTEMFNKQDLFINFNYTHTLEYIYDVDIENILHIHGEVGENNLLLGYPEGQFSPKKYSFDVRAKGVGPYAEIEVDEYINRIEDYYISTAYSNLLEKTKSFYKESKIFLLKTFLDTHDNQIDQIVVYGHSCAIDFTYFDYLNKRYPDAEWVFYVRENINGVHGVNVNNLVKNYSIQNYVFKII